MRQGARRGTGLFLHAVLGVDADDGAVLGLLDAELLEHAPRPRIAAAQAEIEAALRVTPFEAKESARWLRGARAAGRIGAEAARVTVIADRESDIFELFAQRPDGVDLLVRASHDRALGEGSGRMFAAIDAQPEAGRATIDLPAKPGRRARTAVLAVRRRDVEPVRPGGGGNVVRVPGGVRLTLVDVREVDPPPGAEKVHWRLLTTLPVGRRGCLRRGRPLSSQMGDRAAVPHAQDRGLRCRGTEHRRRRVDPVVRHLRTALWTELRTDSRSNPWRPTRTGRIVGSGVLVGPDRSPRKRRQNESIEAVPCDRAMARVGAGHPARDPYANAPDLGTREQSLQSVKGRAWAPATRAPRSFEAVIERARAASEAAGLREYETCGNKVPFFITPQEERHQERHRRRNRDGGGLESVAVVAPVLRWHSV